MMQAVRAPLNNGMRALAYRLPRNQGVFLKSCLGLPKKDNVECGATCKPRRACPEAYICCVVALAKDYNHKLRTTSCICTLQVAQSAYAIIQRCLRLAALLLVFGSSLAYAESFKCGNYFVEVGASKASVLLRCGKPFFTDVISADDERKIEQWTYKGKGYRGFIRILTFDGGALRDIKIGERGD